MEKRIEGTTYFALPCGSIKTYNWRNSGKEAYLKPATDGNGYLRVGLQIKGVLETRKVHRLIAQAFIPNPDNKPEINHKDFNKKNNCVSNLEWCTRAENMAHAAKGGQLSKKEQGYKFINKVIKKGSEIGTSVLKEREVLEIRSKFKPRIYTRQMLAEEYGVKASTIKDIVLRKSWKHI